MDGMYYVNGTSSAVCVVLCCAVLNCTVLYCTVLALAAHEYHLTPAIVPPRSYPLPPIPPTSIAPIPPSSPLHNTKPYYVNSLLIKSKLPPLSLAISASPAAIKSFWRTPVPVPVPVPVVAAVPPPPDCSLMAAWEEEKKAVQ